ncbi:MAG: ParA family protein [Pseudomonadota bacterium]
MSQLVAIVSQKGGVGKTSTAVNLGACLAAIKRRVLLVGMDPQCGLTKSFGVDTGAVRAGLFDMIKDGAAPDEVIYRSHRRLPRLDYLPANVRTAADEAEFMRVITKNQDYFLNAMDLIRPSYDFIFLDCPPRLDQPTTAALAVADSYMVPIQCEYAAMGTVGRLLRAALDAKRQHNNRLAIFGFLITMADKRARFTVKVIQEIRHYLKERVFRTIIPRDPRLAEVCFRGEPVIAYDMDCPGAKSYIQLAREVLSEQKRAMEPLL